jgi:hypothetical protein
MKATQLKAKLAQRLPWAKEPSGIALTVVLFALAVVIAWGRFGPCSL